MRIEITGRNGFEVDDQLREAVRKRFSRISRQVSDLARLEIEVHEEQNPRIADDKVASANLHLKGKTLHAEQASPEMLHTIHELAETMRRQVKRHRELQRKRSRTRELVGRMRRTAAEG